MAILTIAYHSGYGHTKKVAEHVAQGATVDGVEVHLLDVTQVDSAVAGYESGWDLLNASHGIIFGTPTYMGGPSAQFKTFADASSKAWFGGAWKDKIAAGFTNSMSNSGDKSITLGYLATLAMQQEMIWVSLGIKNDGTNNRNGFYLGLGTQSDNAPADETPGEADLSTARRFGKRVAEATLRWNK